jgi:hypothetical protein
MKPFLRTSENWLLITPSLFSLFVFGSVTDNDVDVHLLDTYFIVGNHHLLLIFLFVLILPFIMHKLLRRSKKRQRLFSNIHVFITVVYLSVLYALMYNSEIQKPELYYNQSSFPLVAFLEKLLLLFLILQLIFVVYAFIVLIGSTKGTGTNNANPK